MPLFWPKRLWPYPQRSREPFLWSNVVASGEWKTAIWLLVTATVVYLHAEWALEHEPLRQKHVLVMAVALGCIGIDATAEIVMRWKARVANAQ